MGERTPNALAGLRLGIWVGSTLELDHFGIMDNKMETAILHRDYVAVILG